MKKKHSKSDFPWLLNFQTLVFHLFESCIQHVDQTEQNSKRTADIWVEFIPMCGITKRMGLSAPLINDSLLFLRANLNCLWSNKMGSNFFWRGILFSTHILLSGQARSKILSSSSNFAFIQILYVLRHDPLLLISRS